MPARAGQIVVEMTAGTRTFVTDVEIAKTKLREFGTVGREVSASGVSGVQATSGALRVLEGNMTNNLRASERFVANVLHLGPVLQAAFPIVGAVAFGGILLNLGEKVVDFFKQVADAPNRIRDAFRGITEPLEKENDELQVTNDKLAMEIGKLSGHPGNGLQLGLHEAWVVADKLEATVSKTLKELGEVQKKEGIGALNAFFTGRASTKDDEADVKKFTDSMTRIDAEGMASVRAAKSKEDANKAQDAWNKKALDSLDLEIKKYETLAAATRKLQDLHEGKGNAPTYQMYVQNPGKYTGFNTTVNHNDQSVKLNEQQGTLSTLQGLRSRYALSAEEARMQEQLPALEAAAAARKKAEEERRKERESANRHEREERADWQHLIEERAHVKEEFLYGMDKIDVEEQAEVEKELEKARTMLGEGVSGPVAVTPDKLQYIHETFDLKRSGESAREVKKFWEEIEKSIAKGMEERLREAKKELDSRLSADEHVANVTLSSQRDTLNRNAKTSEDVAKHGGLTGVDLVNAEYQIRIKLASDLAKIEDDRIAKQKNEDEGRKLEADKRAALAKATGDAEAERERGLAALRQKDARDFFQEMRTEAETTGHILYNALHSALDRSSDQLAKLVTGQKTDVGKTVQEIGQGIAKDSIKSAMMQGLGKLGSVLGIKAPQGKPDFTKANPGHVIVDNQAAGGSPSSGLAGLAKFGGVDDNSGSDNSGSDIGGLLKKASGLLGPLLKFGGFMARGGDVDPGASYIVGEHEAELFTPRTAGSITPASKLGMGGPIYHVDARGSDLGAGNRVSRAIEASHHAAVAASVVAHADRKSRTPQRSS
jgi:hypothetical protein